MRTFSPSYSERVGPYISPLAGFFGTWPAAAAGIFFVTQPLIIGNFSVTHSAPSVAYSALAMAFAVIAATMTNKLRRDIVVWPPDSFGLAPFMPTCTA